MPVVRAGTDAYRVPGGHWVDVSAPVAEARKREGAHTAAAVYTEMMVQIMMEYSTLPDLDRMTLGDIVLFYEARRPALKQATRKGK